MQVLNLSFRRFLFRKLGFLKPEDLFKLERLTALRHQLSEEKRLLVKPSDPDTEKIFQARLKDPDLDKNQKDIFKNRLSTLAADPKLQKQLNDLDVQVNKIFAEKRNTLNAYHRAYMASRVVVPRQNHFFQISLSKLFPYIILITKYKWAQFRKFFIFDRNI